MGKVDWERVSQLQQPAEVVLSYDLQKLRRLEEGKRTDLWDKIDGSQNAFELELITELPRDLRDQIASKFSLARLLLATAACDNGEQSKMASFFSSKELSLLEDFERYNAFDVLSIDEIVDRIVRRGEVHNLAEEFHQKEYSKLDSILNDPGIQKDLKLAFNKRYRNRFDKVARGIETYIAKYGPFDAAAKIAVQARGELEKAKEQETQALKERLVSVEKDLQDEKAKGELRGQEIVERLKQIDEAAEGKSTRFIGKSDAKLCELNFIARFDTKMQTFPVMLYSPLEKRTYKIRCWRQGQHISLSHEHTSDIPCNTYSRYVVQQKKAGFLGNKVVRMAIEAVSFSHIEEFEKHGFDTKPANLPDFLSQVTRFTDQAERGEYLHVIGLASPTGWDERVQDEVESASFAHNYISRFVSFCLVDSVTGEVVYNPVDDRVVRFINLFKPEFDHEELERVRNYAASRLQMKGYAVLDDVVAETGEPSAIVNKVFYDSQRAGLGRVRYIKDVGLVLQTLE
jgi:hypothetical protein